ncbi:DMT family transporter [Deinococcus detaillensis]|uniref:DMT family transporter n=1 Tax=Deinococcus detaillensis TaxID=2592048 RepID=A0A553UUL6_9DEIO|nr:DMT family transporter [Deinococcus detaillensis]TSA83898.1 DMT family transporter [Deinococcus detaillensis]
MPRHTLGIALLIVVTCIWGSTFAIVKTLGETLSPQVLIAWRFTIGTLATLPLLLFWRRFSPTPSAGSNSSTTPQRSLWKDGLLVGAWLIVGYGTQTIALQTTSANRAAFITALSVVLVPLWQAIALRRPLSVFLWSAVALAVTGLALLSWEGGALVVGDLWALVCAVSYAGFILTLDRTAQHHAALPFTLVQLASVTVLAWLWALLSGAELLPPSAQWGGLLYLGVVATSLTTLLQTTGQRWVSAAEASIIYALEPVTASLFSFVLIGERVGLRGLLGGGLVIIATVLSQWKNTLAEAERANPPHAPHGQTIPAAPEPNRPHSKDA